MTFLETAAGKTLLTFLWSMTPVLELRFSIPYGAANGLEPWLVYLVSVVGNLLPVPLIMLLVRRVFGWLRRVRWFGPKIDWLERRAHLKGRIVTKYRLLGLMILVAIPLPGTGAWTGALVASVLDIRLKTGFPAIALGVLIAGAITMAVTLGVIQLV